MAKSKENIKVINKEMSFEFENTPAFLKSKAEPRLEEMSLKEIEEYLYKGEKGHADLFYLLNKDDYVITSVKGAEGFHWNDKTKLWEELYHSSLISSISEFITHQVDVIENVLKKSKIKRMKMMMTK